VKAEEKNEMNEGEVNFRVVVVILHGNYVLFLMFINSSMA
jgi:hypothetical protein